jgi:hypothetical protein
LFLEKLPVLTDKEAEEIRRGLAAGLRGPVLRLAEHNPGDGVRRHLAIRQIA